MGKVDNTQEQMGNVSREMEILWKNQKKIARDKTKQNTVTEMKNAFDGLISILDMAEERISELEDTSIKSSKTESKENTVWKKEKQIKISKVYGTT